MAVTRRLGALGLSVLTPNEVTCRRRAIDHAYGSASLCARYSVRGAVSWEGFPSDHACLVLSLTPRQPPSLPATASVPSYPVTTFRLGRRVWGSWRIRLWAFDLLGPLLTAAG